MESVKFSIYSVDKIRQIDVPVPSIDTDHSNVEYVSANDSRNIYDDETNNSDRQ